MALFFLSAAKKWLDSRGIAYEYVSLDNENNFARMRKETHITSGSVSLPVVVIGEEHRQGFDVAWMQKKLKNPKQPG